jgi:hypothetical protein
MFKYLFNADCKEVNGFEALSGMPELTGKIQKVDEFFLRRGLGGFTVL